MPSKSCCIYGVLVPFFCLHFSDKSECIKRTITYLLYHATSKISKNWETAEADFVQAPKTRPRLVFVKKKYPCYKKGVYCLLLHLKFLAIVRKAFYLQSHINVGSKERILTQSYVILLHKCISPKEEWLGKSKRKAARLFDAFRATMSSMAKIALVSRR